MRLLKSKWDQGNGWPKRLDWIEMVGIRGWARQRFELRFPIMAIVGENGAGKSTILQCAASVYAADGGRKDRFASDFFPDTPWDTVKGASIAYAVREGDTPTTGSIRKPTGRWRGNPQRRKRPVEYVDLSRVQPVPARVGYVKLANPNYSEGGTTPFEPERLARMSDIMGRPYDLAKMSTADADANRPVPVLSYGGQEYSGFHQGAGETTIAELLQTDLPKNGLILIDEVESSLHPRAQRRLIHELAERCRVLELQIILTTHSPYVLEELPLEARAYIVQSASTPREIVYGVSPEFAMSRMDDVPHHECELYVEDDRARRMLLEIIAAHDPELVQRCRIIPFGAASVGQALGIMVAESRFPRPSCVFLDGDQAASAGCLLLPGGDAPERVVFEALKARGWQGLASRVGREHPDIADACSQAMLHGDHHEWLRSAAIHVVLDTDSLWQAMTAEWATTCLNNSEALSVTEPIADLLRGIELGAMMPTPKPKPMTPVAPTAPAPTLAQASTPTLVEPIEPEPQTSLFDFDQSR